MVVVKKGEKKENVCEQVTAKSNNVTIYMKPFQQYVWLVKFAVQYIVMKRNVIFLFVLKVDFKQFWGKKG